MGFLPARLRGSRTICSEYETRKAQYAYRCVALPDVCREYTHSPAQPRLNAPTGAWCSLTTVSSVLGLIMKLSQCTYRCVVPPDVIPTATMSPLMSQCTYSSLTIRGRGRLPAVDRSQCTYRCVVLPDELEKGALMSSVACLNAPTGAWCSLTDGERKSLLSVVQSQCTYRCVVLPDGGCR